MTVIEAALDKADLSYQTRAQGLDGKAGFLLGAAGVVVTFAGAQSTIAVVIAQGLAVFSAVTAVWSFAPRIGGEIDPDPLIENYLTKSELETRVTLLATRRDLHKADEEALRSKLRRLRGSMILLLASAVSLLVGSILNIYPGGGSHDRDQRTCISISISASAPSSVRSCPHG